MCPEALFLCNTSLMMFTGKEIKFVPLYFTNLKYNLSVYFIIIIIIIVAVVVIIIVIVVAVICDDNSYSLHT